MMSNVANDQIQFTHELDWILSTDYLSGLLRVFCTVELGLSHGHFCKTVFQKLGRPRAESVQ